jgi:hypothetical protein
VNHRYAFRSRRFDSLLCALKRQMKLLFILQQRAELARLIEPLSLELDQPLWCMSMSQTGTACLPSPDAMPYVPSCQDSRR